jgi:hypothetical protein
MGCKIFPIWVHMVHNIAPVRQFVQNNYAGEVKLHDRQIAVHYSMTDSTDSSKMLCSERNVKLTVLRHLRMKQN